MAKEDNNKQGVHPFDQMMFGNRAGAYQSDKNKQNKRDSEKEQLEGEEQSFDLFETARTMSETYKQLSPYVKGISDMIKKYKA